MTKYRPAANPASPSSRRDIPIRPAAEFCHGAARRDTPVICLSCGRTVPRSARQQRYCSDRCRERGRDRSRKTAVEALKNAPRYPHSGAPTNPLKNINGHNGLQPCGRAGRASREACCTRSKSSAAAAGARSSRVLACEVSTLRPAPVAVAGLPTQQIILPFHHARARVRLTQLKACCTKSKSSAAAAGARSSRATASPARSARCNRARCAMEACREKPGPARARARPRASST